MWTVLNQLDKLSLARLFIHYCLGRQVVCICLITSLVDPDPCISEASMTTSVELTGSSYKAHVKPATPCKNYYLDRDGLLHVAGVKV